MQLWFYLSIEIDKLPTILSHHFSGPRHRSQKNLYSDDIPLWNCIYFLQVKTMPEKGIDLNVPFFLGK